MTETKTFYTADLHLGHERILELCGRPFRTVDEMNRALIRNWNAVVGDDDQVWVLGDVALGRFDETLPLVGELAGHKVLVPGNHDRYSLAQRGAPEKREAWRRRYEEYFDVVLDASVAAWRRDVNDPDGGHWPALLSHFPYHGDSGDVDRWRRLRPRDAGMILLHGHVHERWTTRGRMFNVGVDVHGFAPVSELEVVRWLRLQSAVRPVPGVGHVTLDAGPRVSLTPGASRG